MSKKYRAARPQPGPEPSTPWIYPLAIVLISLGIVLGLAALVAGYLVVTRSPSPSEAAARAAQIPRAGAQELKNVPAGQQSPCRGGSAELTCRSSAILYSTRARTRQPLVAVTRSILPAWLTIPPCIRIE